jgi:hypothetical protein
VAVAKFANVFVKKPIALLMADVREKGSVNESV